MKYRWLHIGAITMGLALSVPCYSQTLYEYKREDADLFFFDKGLSQYIPHIVRMYEEGTSLHRQVWETDSLHPYRMQPPIMMITDWEDSGNGGAASIPYNFISIGMAPLNASYYISPTTERYHHLFRHELTHSVVGDKPARSDRGWRKAMGGKFNTDSDHPFSALWSFLGTPRWYAPRWYHEGIACFMETWMGNGMGRALGGYDEMYFRSIVRENEPLYSVVGLETEGTTSDFQVGTNSYLYGTRFTNYLVKEYGFGKLRDFYNRSEDSKRFFNSQFKKIYGQPLRRVWNEWRTYERTHQQAQLDTLAQYPLTPTIELTDKALGSMSPIVVDEEENKAYMAVNYPGDFAHIEEMDLRTHARKRLITIDDPQLYQTCYLTLDCKRKRLIFTTQNNQFRGLHVYDLKKRKQTKRMKYQRVSDIVYDNAGDCLYGLFVNQGVLYLCRYDAELEKREMLYPFPFGASVLDMDVSHDGRWLIATLSGVSGEHSLIRFDLNGLKDANFQYETLYKMEDSNLGQFRFAPGDSTLIGSSYYTGVSNLWSLDLKTRQLDLLSNTQTGLFAPVQLAKEDSILALQFERNGLRPVKLARQVLKDANSVELLGQKTYEAHAQELEKLAVLDKPMKPIEFGDVYHAIEEYHPIKRLQFKGAYPEISGFRDKEAWNHVTPVLGYRIGFQDPLGLHSLKMSVGISPWSHHHAKNQYHAELEWKYYMWEVSAAWNPTSFYDLFGPIRSSRKGWQVGAGYSRSFTMLSPFKYSWGVHVNAYGDMDALPLFQNVEVDGITSFQTASAYFSASKLNNTLGATTNESGWSAKLQGYTYLADGTFFPTVIGNYDRGWLVPVMRNTCFWLRGALGQNFGNRNSVFGNEYFGGFGNNWVDNRAANRYRSLNAMAGGEIDAIQAHSFAKLTAELSLRPIRYNNVGFLNLYPTYSQFNIFSSGLYTNPWYETDRHQYANIGIQLNNEVVLFKHMRTTWSLGYAYLFGSEGTRRGDWLFSLKLF